MKEQNNSGITILGLGPGDIKHLTVEAHEHLSEINEIYVRTRIHPMVHNLPKNLKVFSFDEVYEHEEKFEDVYENIIQQVLELGRRPQGVTYAVPGHPYVAEATSPEIIRRARREGLRLRVIEGLSFLEPVFTALDIDPFPYLLVADAIDIGMQNYPQFSPSQPLLIGQIYSKQIASEVKLTLANVFPDEHPIRLVHAAGTSAEIVEDLCLYEIDRSPYIGLLTILFVPALEKEASFEAFQEIIARLRAPDGCPWDKKQTHQSLRPYLLEETYELIDALDKEDPEKMAEEFGDLLLQILLHAEIAIEEGEFNMTDILQGIHRKIVRRHPHVFKQQNAKDADEVLVNWEKIKEEERQENGEAEKNKGLLDGIPAALPALLQAQQIQERAARVGFDWDTIEPVLGKVKEEMEEVQEAVGKPELASEVGDLLFSVVNLARWYEVDAESVLRETSQRFKKRFKYIEMQARKNGQDLNSMTLDEMDKYWDEAKGKPGF